MPAARVATSSKAFLATKHGAPTPEDPIEGLRAGWDLAVEFAVDSPPSVLTLRTSTACG
ncbi:hypothetical protein GCM10017776_16430 [Streptomyces griseoluteus]|nr:hypothetical protein GCM10017776_16430 [Streptomyces griseoluteus]